MIKYPKIRTPFQRDVMGSKKLIENVFQDEAIAYLKNCLWCCTEKVDGTNIGIYWDGHGITFQGRTEKSEIPKALLQKLNGLFGGDVNEELFEQKFGSTHVILYGEGYGGDIQKKKHYREDCSFILFDVYLPESDLWLKRDAIEDIAYMFNIDAVPIVMTGTLQEAVGYVKRKPKSIIADTDMEGLVCKPIIEMRDRQNQRIVIKVKVKDFV